jgi:hypothetical protein
VLQWQVEGHSPLTVAGAAAELENPHRVPFCVPRNAGTDDEEDYSRLAGSRKRPGASGPEGTVSSLNFCF